MAAAAEQRDRLGLSHDRPAPYGQPIHEWARGRVLGGSTAINAMAHVRGHASDFDRWVGAGCTGWGYADLLPYFIRSETYAPGASPFTATAGPSS